MVLRHSSTTYLKRYLSEGWHFKQEDNPKSNYLPVSQFPTVIHLDLLHHHKISDPTIDLNREDCQWVGEKKWLYRTTIPYTESSSRPNVDLVFEGLDTFATVMLNGKTILEADNMFLEYRVSVTDLLAEGDNDLEITFDSAFLRGRELEEQQGFKNEFWNGDSSRMNVRKIGCHYGWDWGPRLMTAGPYKPVYIEEYESRIEELDIDIEVMPTFDSAILTVSATVAGDDGGSVTLSLFDPEEEEIVSCQVKSCQKQKIVLKHPKLWYPVNYGEQPLYTVTAEVGTHCFVRRIGIRLLEVVQQPLQPATPSSPKPVGLSFFFRINHIPIYCQGTDWIPPDTFLPRMTPQRYRQALVDHALGSNQNMIRVWGGGQYESQDDFYSVCDEQGILVWQDLMFGCGAYPVNDKLLASIGKEVTQNVKRLKHHPCIVLWAGNNEDYMFAEIHNLTYNPSDTCPTSWLKTNWPARYYYEHLFPSIISSHSPRIPYLPSSPLSPPSHDLPHRLANDTRTGDTHAWRVWMADQQRLPYQQYGSISGRFVSEFGMKSYPCLRTLEAHITDPKQRHPQSMMLDAWHMAPEDQRTLALYLNENYRHGTTLAEYVYATQLLQAEAMDFAVRAFRRNWGGQGREECGGSLIWQLNDCFPAVSWSLIDASQRRKLAWYTTKRAYSPLTINAQRFVTSTLKPAANKHSDVDIQRTVGLHIWASNLTINPVEALLSIRIFNVGGRSSSSSDAVFQDEMSVTLDANRSQELKTYHPLPCTKAGIGKQVSIVNGVPLTNTVVALTLSDAADGTTLARFIEWPQPLRHLDLHPDGVSMHIIAGKAKGQRLIKLKANRPVKALEIYANEYDLSLDDNCIDLLPDEEVVVVWTVEEDDGLKDEDVLIRHLGSCVG